MPKKKPAMTGEELKKVRAAIGLSQVQLSKTMNLSTQTISGWEGGFKADVNEWRRLFILLSAKA